MIVYLVKWILNKQYIEFYHHFLSVHLFIYLSAKNNIQEAKVLKYFLFYGNLPL